MAANPVVWFEIYVQDMARAKAFYEAVFECQLSPLGNPDAASFPDMEMLAFLKKKYPGLKISLHAGELNASLAPPEDLGFHITRAVRAAGATRIVIQEDVTRDGERITVTAAADSGRNIRPLGQDFRIGDRLSPRRLRANDLALLAAMNIPAVQVARKPVVALVAMLLFVFWSAF